MVFQNVYFTKYFLLIIFALIFNYPQTIYSRNASNRRNKKSISTT